MQANVQDRLVGGAGAAIVVTLLGYALLIGMTVDIQARGEQALTLLNLIAPPPKPPQPKPHVEPRKASKASGKASPRNLKNKPTEIVTPKIPVPLPIPTVIASAPKAGLGAASSAGASDRPGPGQGAGGQGNGTGSGGAGDGDGNGDGVPPRLIKGRLKFSDLSADLRDRQAAGTVAVRYSVNIDGSASDCVATASSGNAELDRQTCQLIQQRFRFKPSRDDAGHAVPSMIEERHSWEIDRDVDAVARP